MKILRNIVAALVLSGIAIGAAQAQTLKKGALSGDILSASASVPFSTTESVLLVPIDRTYVLTQLCLKGGGGDLAGSTLGVIASAGTASLASGACTSYSPGIAFQPGEEITFTATAPFPGQMGISTATITGVLVE